MSESTDAPTDAVGTLMGEPGKLKVADLHTFLGNPRRGNIARIAESLAVNGMYKPVVVNKGTHTGRPNEVLAGNHTLMAARELGWSEVNAWVIDVDEHQAKKIVAADNRTADLGEYDNDAMIELLGSLDDLEGTGYDADDLSALQDLENDGLWDNENPYDGGGSDPGDHSDQDNHKFFPKIDLRIPPMMMDAWRELLDRYSGEDDVDKLEAHLKAQGVLQ
ncbi:ParB-like nuclease domain protein [Mycobacterium phage Typha]|uniref:ParB-like nuclease domain protein n=1 Tax=Mycobacterium phage Typha TaxID=2517971 RepID=A0A482JAB6_9CAUD|nr:ParB-like partition protein [Mycobacterium phage Typha]QBP29658.1 ParB-like nuclease domain protein [Mycobacterium phage Typha]